MDISLNKNGAFVERRKMYYNFPLHNMKSYLEFNWKGEEELIDQNSKRLVNKREKDLDYIKQKYNQNIQKKLGEKYSLGYQPYNPSPNNSAHMETQQTLSREIQHFNNSKLLSNSALFENPQRSPGRTPKVQEDEREREKERRQSSLQTLNPMEIYESPKSRGNGRIVNESFGNNLNNSNLVEKIMHKEYLKEQSPKEYMFRNVMPDKLEPHLRDLSKRQKYL